MDEEMEVRKLSTLFSETQLVSGRAFIWTEAACLWRLLWSHFLFSWPYFVGKELALQREEDIMEATFIPQSSQSLSHLLGRHHSDLKDSRTLPCQLLLKRSKTYAVWWIPNQIKIFILMWRMNTLPKQLHSWLKIPKIHPLKVVCFPRILGKLK